MLLKLTRFLIRRKLKRRYDPYSIINQLSDEACVALS